MPGNTPTGLLPTVLPGGSPGTGEQSSPGQAPDSVPAAAPAGTAGSSTAGSSTAGSSTAATPGAAAAPQATAAIPGAAGAAGAAARRPPSRHAWYRLVSPLAVLVIWQLVSSSGLVSEQKLPSPSTVLHTAITLITTNSAAYGTLQGAMAVSLERVAIGFALGGSVGLVLAVIAGLSRLGENAVDPLLQMLRTLPLFGLIPVFIVWLGIGELPKVLLIALGSAIPLYLNTFAGIRNVDAKLAEAGQSLGLTRAEMIRHIILPGALPQMLVGLRQSLGVAWLALVVAEQINANAGLGFMISQATQFLRNDVIFVALLVYCLLGLITDALVRLLERRALAWRRGLLEG
jgi:sulfonate transport system permease protein